MDARDSLPLDHLLDRAVTQFLEDLELLDTLSAVYLSSGGSVVRRDLGSPSHRDDPLRAYLRLCDVIDPEAASGPLGGLTVSVKDTISVAGIPQTYASDLDAVVPTQDAVVVSRLLQSGARIVGKNNMDDHASFLDGQNSAIGPALNPYDSRFSAGGSSGGTAAAVGAGLADAGIGVDTGGSGRIPAAYCGLPALKPTAGLIPSDGIIEFDPSMMTPTLIARTHDTLRLVFDSIASATPLEAGENLSEAARPPQEGATTIGVVREAWSDHTLSVAASTGRDRVVRRLLNMGCRTQDVSVPLWQHGWRIAGPILTHNSWVAMASFHQYSCEGRFNDPELARQTMLSRRARSVTLPIMLQLRTRFREAMIGAGKTHSFAVAERLRAAIRHQIGDALSTCDALIVPSNTGAPPRVSTARRGDEDFLRLYEDRGGGHHTQMNLSGNPALVVPSGVDDDGLPTAVQLVAAHGREHFLLSLGASIFEDVP